MYHPPAPCWKCCAKTWRHRHQGRLRRRRLRRLHRGAGRGRGRPAAIPGHQQLHPAGAFDRRPGAVDRGRPRRRPLIQPPSAAQRARAQQLHPAQEAMVQCHGSQCGFCTPGFVMSLFGLYQNQGLPGRVRHPRTGPGRPVGQPVPLHRLPADPGRGATMHQFPARRVNEPELLSKLEQLKTIPRWGSANLDLNSVYMTPNNLLRAAGAAPHAPRRADRRRLHRCGPVGHQACTAVSPRCSTSPAWPSCAGWSATRTTSPSAPPSR